MNWRRFTNLACKYWWLWLAILAMGSRLLYVLAFCDDTLGWGDELTYDTLAWNLARGYGYSFVPDHPSLLRAPMYPMILSGLYGLFGHSYTVVRLAQVLEERKISFSVSNIRTLDPYLIQKADITKNILSHFSLLYIL